MAVASLVLGIVALVFAFIPGISWIAWIAGVVGIVLGALGRKKEPEKKGMATAGMVMSIVAVALGTIIFIACAAACTAIGNAIAEEAGGDLSSALESAFANLG